MAVARRLTETPQRPSTPVSTGRLALNKREAADALGVSIDFLEDHVMHELRVVRCGRRRLIPVAELERWLDARASRVLDVRPRRGC